MIYLVRFIRLHVLRMPYGIVFALEAFERLEKERKKHGK